MMVSGAVTDRPALRYSPDTAANGEVAMTIDLPVFQAYRPEPTSLAGVRARPLVGREQALPFFREAADWLAEALGTEVASAPGAHGPQFDHPRELAELIRSARAS